ncbi:MULTISPECIES: chemotaxis protein [Pseudoalteromonas]|uniref:Chemotaxis protein n=1 Tax=Pseudoalteromonas amylolytica TaxID=1859457 RepID=A0A1S1MNP8_9GAMM|nr:MULTISPECIES: chemotaxis protein [Pseudoalteromonas]OHU85013.1 chemotaxis protein [Pseudoalteromonas sp. JW3]OHU90036.1 chemotaxis protein [Pseudoalteromonas amylolytica]
MTKNDEAAQAVRNFVRVANIIANLDTILTEAKNLSLTAKNARVVALRAGDSAFGFKPITNFIDEFSDLTIKTTKQISQLSSQLFSIALSVVRCSDFQHHLNACAKHSQSKAINHLQRGINRELMQTIKQLESVIDHLESYFEDIKKQMRSAEYIAVTSRVEASNAGEFSESLQSVSDFITGAAKKIKSAIHNNLKEINQLKGALR